MSLVADVVVARGAFRLAVSIEVAAGETLAVMGPNGAGKSTLLAALCGLVACAEGRIVCGATCWDDPAAGVFVPPERRGCGVVFGDGRTFDHLRAVDDVAFGLRARGAGSSTARAVAAEWLDRVGLGGLGNRRSGELSSGQRRRVELARALAPGPQVVLLDEPTAALDDAGTVDLRRLVTRELARLGVPAVLVTHDLDEARLLADRIVRLDAGRLAPSASGPGSG